MKQFLFQTEDLEIKKMYGEYHSIINTSWNGEIFDTKEEAIESISEVTLNYSYFKHSNGKINSRSIWKVNNDIEEDNEKYIDYESEVEFVKGLTFTDAVIEVIKFAEDYPFLGNDDLNIKDVVEKESEFFKYWIKELIQDKTDWVIESKVFDKFAHDVYSQDSIEIPLDEIIYLLDKSKPYKELEDTIINQFEIAVRAILAGKEKKEGN